MLFKKIARWIGNIELPDVFPFNTGTGWCWYCEWPRKGKICPIHKVKMQPMNRHSFKSR